MAPVALFIFSLLTHLVVLHSTEEGELHNKRCSPEDCNENVGQIQFPFKSQTQPPECGLFTVDCSDRHNPKIQLKEKGYWHEFESISPANTIFINDKKLQQLLRTDPCNDQFFNNLSLPSPSPVFDELFTHNLTLFKCNNTPLHNRDLKYHCNNYDHTYYAISSDDSLPRPPPSCSIIRIPREANPDNLFALSTMFHLQLRVSEACNGCHDREGECLVDDKGKFKCSVGEKGIYIGIDVHQIRCLPHLYDPSLFIHFLSSKDTTPKKRKQSVEKLI